MEIMLWVLSTEAAGELTCRARGGAGLLCVTVIEASIEHLRDACFHCVFDLANE